MATTNHSDRTLLVVARPARSVARRRLRRSRSLALVLALLPWLVAACAPGATSGTGIGQPAPALTGTTLEGASFDLADQRGKPVVVNFWASWCVPCRSEFPVLRDAQAANAGDGLVIVGVLFKDDPAPAQDFIDSFGATWPTVDDPDDAIASTWRVAAPPQTYFIDPGGILRSIQIGELTAEDFARQYAAIAP